MNDQASARESSTHITAPAWHCHRFFSHLQFNVQPKVFYKNKCTCDGRIQPLPIAFCVSVFEVGRFSAQETPEFSPQGDGSNVTDAADGGQV